MLCLWFSLLVSFIQDPASPAQKESSVPRFEDFPAGEMFRGKPARVHWPTDYPRYDFFKLSIKDLIAGGVNFAGHYAVREWSCGTNCRWLVILDMKTGKFLRSSPYGSLSLYDEQMPKHEHDWLQLRPDSRLLIASGCFDVEGSKKPVECGTKFFKLEKGRFVLIRYDSYPTPSNFK
jgi:hypothetical protein